jgi:hypothetical protein
MPPRFESSQLLALHRRLCDGDRTASEELAELLLDPLVERISRQFPQADEHWHCQAVADALLDYCARPHQFDEGRGVPLVPFLLMTLDAICSTSCAGKHDGELTRGKLPRCLLHRLSNLTLSRGISYSRKRAHSFSSGRKIV